MGECIRYSEAFKLQVVRELEEGKHTSCWAAREAYGIGVQVNRRGGQRYGELVPGIFDQGPGDLQGLVQNGSQIDQLLA